MPALAAEVLRRAPQRLHQINEFLRHLVALVMINLLVAKHPRFAGDEAGNDVETPPAIGDMVDGRTKLGKVKRMPCSIEHMDGRDQNDALRDYGKRSRGDERVERLLAKAYRAAGAAFSQPLRQAEHQIKSQLLGTLR